MLKKFAPWYIAFSVVFIFVVSLLNAKNDSAIFDEVAHIPAGYSYLTEHDMRLNPEHPPLVKALAAIPLLFLDLRFDTTAPYWTTDVNGQWDAGRAFLYTSGNDWYTILFWSRVPVILIGIALGLFLFYWGRRYTGSLFGGIIAFTLVMFDPNILGHNHYVTTDVGIAAALAFSMYFFLAFLKAPTWKNALLGGLFLGVAHLTKFSSVLLLPLYGLAIFLYPLVSSASGSKLARWGKTVSKGVVAFGVSMIVVWIAYAGFFFHTPKDTVQKTIDFYFSPSDSRASVTQTNAALSTLNAPAFTRPLAEYGLGVAMVFKRVAGGNGAYFMGEVSNKAFPAYFPTVFLLKETLPFLALLLCASIFALWKCARTLIAPTHTFWKTRAQKVSASFSRNPDSWLILAFVFLYAYISITGNLNIGFRHLFPILPFLFLFIAKQFVNALELLTKNGQKTLHNALAFTATTLLILLVATAAWAYPYYMSYFNPLAGGSFNGYRYATDSNADWGQDLNRLRDWVRENNIEKIRVDYFGGGDILKIVGQDKAILWWDSKRPVEPGWYAVSVNFSQGSIYDKTKKDDASYRWLNNYSPVAQVGTSIFIYFVK